MSKMTLRKALQKKNILAGKIAELRTLIKSKNSYLEGTAANQMVNTLAVYAEMHSLVGNLVELKSAITRANIDLYPLLAELEESKGMIGYLSSIPAKEEVENVGYGEREIKRTWKCHMTEPRIRELRAQYQTRVEKIQEDIDEYNATHFVEVSF